MDEKARSFSRGRGGDVSPRESSPDASPDRRLSPSPDRHPAPSPDRHLLPPAPARGATPPPRAVTRETPARTSSQTFPRRYLETLAVVHVRATVHLPKTTSYPALRSRRRSRPPLRSRRRSPPLRSRRSTRHPDRHLSLSKSFARGALSDSDARDERVGVVLREISPEPGVGAVRTRRKIQLGAPPAQFDGDAIVRRRGVARGSKRSDVTLSAVVPYVRLEPTGAFVEGHAAVLGLGAGAAATRAGRAGRGHRSRERANASVFVRVLDRTLFVSLRVRVVFVTLRVSLGGCVGRSDVVVSPASSPFVGVVASSLRFFTPGGGRRRGEYPSPALAMRAGGAFAEREPSTGKRRRRGAHGGFGGTRDEDVSAGLELAGGEGAPWDVRRVFRLGGHGVARARRRRRRREGGA